MDVEPKWIGSALSRARFAPYLAAKGGDLTAAIRLYWWNVEISSAFYPSLHCLEVAIRNAMHARLGAKFRHIDWWNVVPLRDNGRLLVAEAARKVRRRIMHHEPIHHRHLKADHDTIYRLLSCVSPDLVAQLTPFDQVSKLLQERP
jgi:hypothetical protein